MADWKMINVDKCFWCSSTKVTKIAKRSDGLDVQECGECKLMMVAQIPEDLSVYYDTEDYFNPDEDTVTGYHENYDLISPFYLYWQGALIEEIARKAGKTSFLEVGCATGNALEMVQQFDPKIKLEGIDLSSYAIEICKQKGLNASVSKINGWSPGRKYDLIFSSETMEHVDELYEFVEGVKHNLEQDGVFLFYVPAVDKLALIEQSEIYPPLTTSLEHISYFTKEFLEAALTKSFGSQAYVFQIEDAAGENYAIGVVSTDKGIAQYVEKFIDGFLSKELSTTEPQTLYNLATISSKFANFSLAENYLAKYEESNAPVEKTSFLRGVLRYNKGELLKARVNFQKSLGNAYANTFILKVMLAVERELGQIYATSAEMLAVKSSDFESRAVQSEAKVREYTNSKIVYGAILLRKVLMKIRGLFNPLRNFVKKYAVKIYNKTVRLLPLSVRKPLRYVLKFEWLVKHNDFVNEKISEKSPLVTVVIPYYNRASTIDETITSLQNQTYRNFEVILVDDGSTEQASIDRLATLKPAGLKFKVVHQDNAGVANARNHGISLAKSKYIICLDSDDTLAPTYMEKCLVVLETAPSMSLVTTYMRMFGVENQIYRHEQYNAVRLIDNNMVITASMYKREGWEANGGYKSNLGYEDWEFWINLAEHGYWGTSIPEPLFNYRTAASSRYIDDQSGHKTTLHAIRSLHPKYKYLIKRSRRRKRFKVNHLVPNSAFVNLDSLNGYAPADNNNPNVLVTIPWMTFGGAETLIYNYCREITDAYNVSFITGLRSEHEWEYKFAEISKHIYHLANLFNDESLYVEFISNYITTRDISILHIIHNGYMFGMLEELKRRHPNLKVIVTMFNDRVEYFEQSIGYEPFIDEFVSDNEKVASHYRSLLKGGTPAVVIPNGINCYDEFNLSHYDRNHERSQLGVHDTDIAVFYVGRLSVEKNPNVFIDAAKQVQGRSGDRTVKFFIVGDGPMNDEVRRMIAGSGSKDISYLGYQSEVARYLSAADIFVLPSSIEGFPLSILEAMAMKAAIVASDVGAVAEVVTDGKDGIIVTPGSANEIAAAILKLHNDPKLLRSMQDSARAKVEKKYSNTILGANYQKLYKEIL